MGSTSEHAEALARRVVAVSDPKLRVAYLRHELVQMDVATVADLVLVVASRAQAHEEPFRTLMLTLSLALADPSVDEMRRAVAAAANWQGQPEVARLLDDRHYGAGEDEGHHVPDFGKGRTLTLGERKTLARKRDRRLLERVLWDPHPTVIEIVLGNPALTEDDVVRLCARRPVPAEVLRQVFRSSRWIVRYRVRRALVLNPFCPLDIALQLTAHLNVRDARVVGEATELPEELREACRRIAESEVVH